MQEEEVNWIDHRLIINISVILQRPRSIFVYCIYCITHVSFQLMDDDCVYCFYRLLTGYADWASFPGQCTHTDNFPIVFCQKLLVWLAPVRRRQKRQWSQQTHRKCAAVDNEVTQYYYYWPVKTVHFVTTSESVVLSQRLSLLSLPDVIHISWSLSSASTTSFSVR